MWVFGEVNFGLGLVLEIFVIFVEFEYFFVGVFGMLEWFEGWLRLEEDEFDFW